MYILVSNGVRNGVIKLETKLVRGFYCFCGRFSDLEIVMATSLDIKSLLKRTLNQCGSVFFSKIEIVSASHWRVCLGHGRVMRVCERCVSARLFTLETFFREYSFDFMLHRRKFTINLGLFPRTKKKIYMLPKRIQKQSHSEMAKKKKWQRSESPHNRIFAAGHPPSF